MPYTAKCDIINLWINRWRFPHSATNWRRCGRRKKNFSARLNGSSRGRNGLPWFSRAITKVGSLFPVRYIPGENWITKSRVSELIKTLETLILCLFRHFVCRRRLFSLYQFQHKHRAALRMRRFHCRNEPFNFSSNLLIILWKIKRLGRVGSHFLVVEATQKTGKQKKRGCRVRIWTH